ncbi:MAG: hypothetical protein ACE5DY_09515 [Mariprofundaceae bacterium]
MQRTEVNQVRLVGTLEDIRERWTTEGSLSVIASLYLPRPKLGPVNKTVESDQPLPLRALAESAKQLLRFKGKDVAITGSLRRRYYHRSGSAQWGQVEIWVDDCCPTQVQEDDQ